MFQMKPNNHFFRFKNQNSLKMSKKRNFENPKVINNSTISWGHKNSTIWGPPVVCILPLNLYIVELYKSKPFTKQSLQAAFKKK